MNKMKNTLMLSVLIAGAAWTNVATPNAMPQQDPLVAKLIERLNMHKAILNKQADDWYQVCLKKPFLERPWCIAFQVTSRQVAVATIDAAIQLGKRALKLGGKVAETVVYKLRLALDTAEKATRKK